MSDDLAERGAHALVIGGGTAAAARMAGRLLKTPFPILHDPERDVYRAYGFGRRMGVIQQSGTVLVDRDGIIRYAERGLNPFEALDPGALLRVLEAADTA